MKVVEGRVPSGDAGEKTETYSIICPFGRGKILTVTKGAKGDCLNHPVTECKEEYKSLSQPSGKTETAMRQSDSCGSAGNDEWRCGELKTERVDSCDSSTPKDAPERACFDCYCENPYATKEDRKDCGCSCHTRGNGEECVIGVHDKCEMPDDCSCRCHKVGGGKR